MNPRYFIGITLPDDLSRKIASIQLELLTSRFVMEPLVPHITLLDPNTLLELSPMYFVPKVRQAAKDFLPLDIELADLDSFDRRALFISVKSQKIRSLREELVSILPDHIRSKHTVSREFIPHVTLAQAKPNQKLEHTLIDVFRKQITPLLPREFAVSSLDQFQWIRPRTYKVKRI